MRENNLFLRLSPTYIVLVLLVVVGVTLTVSKTVEHFYRQHVDQMLLAQVNTAGHLLDPGLFIDNSDMESIRKRLAELKQTPYPVRLTLVDIDGRVVADLL